MHRSSESAVPRRFVGEPVLTWLLLWICTPAPIASQSALQELEKSFVQLYEAKSSAVVRVKVATRAEGESGNQEVALTVFSGFFISPDGLVLSNALPAEGVTRLWIEKDGDSYLAEAVASDERSNVGLLQALNLPEEFGFIDLSGQQSKPPIGSISFAVTSPLDLAPSPAWGFVSGRESHFSDITFPFTYTRIGIPIGPAEGGSPFFDTSGRLLGVAVAALPDINSAYLVPTEPLRRIVGELQSKNAVTYGTLNLTFEERHDTTAGKNEVVIRSVASGSPADRSGLRPGDELVSLSDESIDSIDQVRDLLFFSETGVFLPIVIRRDGQMKEFALMLEERAPGSRD